MSDRLTLALQRSGRLGDEALAFLRACGVRVRAGSRTLTARATGFPLEMLFVRSKDVPRIVADGAAAIGICGLDALAERAPDGVDVIERLGFGPCRLSIAVPADSGPDAFEPTQLDGARIATSFPQALGRWLDAQGVSAEAVVLGGSVEIAPRLGIADAVCDLVSTGSTLASNGLVEVATVFESQAVLIAGPAAHETPELLDRLLLRVRSRLAAQRTRYVVMNAPERAVGAIKAILPGLKTPTVSRLADAGWVSLSTVVEVDRFWDTMEDLKAAGASDVLVLPIEQLVR